MIRIVVAMIALAVAGAASLQLQAETRYRLLGARPVTDLLDVDSAIGPGVVFVFQREDCFGDGDLVGSWNRLHAADRFSVRGLIVGDGELSPLQEGLFRELRVEMPVSGISRQAALAVAERLGYTRTPFAVVQDADGRIVASFPADRDVPVDVLERLIAGV